MRCTNCGKKLPSKIKFCSYCGKKIKDTNSTKIKNYFQKIKSWFLKLNLKNLLLSLIVLFFVLWLLGVDSSQESILFGNSSLEEQLKATVQKQYSLIRRVEDGGGGIEELYDFYSDEHPIKQNGVDKFAEEIISHKQELSDDYDVDHSEYELNDVYVNGNIGNVDRTIYGCKNQGCSDTSFILRGVKQYVYADESWKMTDEEVYCPRFETHNMPDEFQRAISLIIQRAKNAKNSGTYGESIGKIQNCLNIKYGTSENISNDIEGYFEFSPTGEINTLNIVVSPRYVNKDDLTTALLLMHEITHVLNYVGGLQNGTEISCEEDEAQAFNNTIWLIRNLKQDEKDSIIARDTSSPELNFVNKTLLDIDKYPGYNFEEQAKAWIKATGYCK